METQGCSKYVERGPEEPGQVARAAIPRLSIASSSRFDDWTAQVTEYSYLREEESLRRMMESTGSIARSTRAVRQTGCGALDLCFLARGCVDAIYGGESQRKKDRGMWACYPSDQSDFLNTTRCRRARPGDNQAFEPK